MTNKNVTTVAGVVGAVGAVLLGRLLGWLFGLQFVLPIVVGLAVARAFENHKASRYAAALGVQAGYLTWIVLGLIIDAAHSQLYLGILGIGLHLVSVVGFIALIVQPGVPPALLLMVRHAYSLLLVFLSLPSIIKAHQYVSWSAIVNTIITGAIAVAMIVLLARTLKSEQ
jgi:hypothetical protein